MHRKAGEEKVAESINPRTPTGQRKGGEKNHTILHQMSCTVHCTPAAREPTGASSMLCETTRLGHHDQMLLRHGAPQSHPHLGHLQYLPNVRCGVSWVACPRPTIVRLRTSSEWASSAHPEIASGPASDGLAIHMGRT